METVSCYRKWNWTISAPQCWDIGRIYVGSISPVQQFTFGLADPLLIAKSGTCSHSFKNGWC